MTTPQTNQGTAPQVGGGAGYTVSAALRACEIPGSRGMLNEQGRLIAFDVRQAAALRKLGSDAAADYQASAERLAAEVLAEREWARARFTPMIARHSRAAIAKAVQP
jgi:hypothetical protein